MEFYVKRSDDYLAHHGILGMKWGKRNGPPYPLDSEDHSASEKKAGWRRSLSKGYTDAKNSNMETKFKLTDKQRKILKISAAAGITTLAVYGAYKYQIPQKIYDNGKRYLQNRIGEIGLSDIDVTGSEPITNSAAYAVPKKLEIHPKVREVSERTGIPLKSTPTSLYEDAIRCNPNFTPGQGNCSKCTINMVLNRLGLDSEAQLMPYGDLETRDIYKKVFRGIQDPIRVNFGKGDVTKEDVRQRFEEAITKLSGNSEYSCGAIAREGHTYFWEKVKNDITFIDAQHTNAKTPILVKKLPNGDKLEHKLYIDPIECGESQLEKIAMTEYLRDNIDVFRLDDFQDLNIYSIKNRVKIRS